MTETILPDSIEPVETIEPIRIPDMLRGAWKHAIFLTYGFDPLFFEHHLLKLLGDGCRNRLVLADGVRLREMFKGYAANNEALTHLNHRYVAAGIENRQAAHAKLVLLASAKRGRLLVGSGNLNLNGYTSGGEQFVCYNYSAEAPEQLPAFKSALDLLRQLNHERLIPEVAGARLDQLERQASWLTNTVGDAERPVRHNLNRSFLNQFADAVAGRPVDELVVMAPFYDPEADALAQLMQRLQPAHCRVIVQRGKTSADPVKLQQVLAAAPGTAEVVEAYYPNEDHTPYLHAKFYLAKLKNKEDGAVCLAGSPNLSRRAMLNTHTNGRGNIELANLLFGTWNQFDPVFGSLVLPSVSLDDPELGISYQSNPAVTDTDEDDDLADDDENRFRLTSGVQYTQHLVFEFAGALPCPLAELQLQIGGDGLPATGTFSLSESGDQLVIELSAEGLGALNRPVALRVAWSAGSSNPIFVFHNAHLQHELDQPASLEALKDLGKTDLEDEELGKLLEDLRESMVIEPDQLWQMVGKDPQAAVIDGSQDSGVSSGIYSYADDLGIRDEALENHPKMQAYLRLRSGRSTAANPIAMMLGSILDNFNGLIETAKRGDVGLQANLKIDDGTGGEGEGDVESEAEAEAEEAERERQTKRKSRRLAREFKKFIKKFVNGLSSEAYQAKVGPEVISTNTIAFSVLLHTLLHREFFEEERIFLIERFLDTLKLIWGSADHDGYLATLDEETQSRLADDFAHYHNLATILAVFYWSEPMLRKQTCLKRRLRDCLQWLLSSPNFVITVETVEGLWALVRAQAKFEPPTVQEVSMQLESLVTFKTADEFNYFSEKKFRKGNFSIQSVKDPQGDPGNRSGEQLTLTKTGLMETVEDAKRLLTQWLFYNDRPTYYQIVVLINGEKQLIAPYFKKTNNGVLWNPITNDEEEFKLKKFTNSNQAHAVDLLRLTFNNVEHHN
jgi:hypothetical protein